MRGSRLWLGLRAAVYGCGGRGLVVGSECNESVVATGRSRDGGRHRR